MGKPSAPKAPDPYQTAGADFAYNNLSQYTPYGNMIFQPPSFQNGQQSGAGSMTMNLSPELQSMLDKQLKVSGITLDQALARQGELSNLGKLPSPDRGKYEKLLFDRQKGLLDPVFAEQERAMRDRLSNQGLAVGSEAYGYDQGQFMDERSQSYERAAMDSTLGAGDLMSQEISNAAALRQIPFNEIAALLGIQQVQMPTMGSFHGPRGADFMGAQALQSGMQQQNYSQQMGVYGDMLGGLFGLGSAGIMKSDRRLKKNIHRIGTHKLGIGIYEFDYIWGAHAIGVMADEVLEVMPEAVTEVDGFLAVNYGML
jgi:hypothetical protein